MKLIKILSIAIFLIASIVFLSSFVQEKDQIIYQQWKNDFTMSFSEAQDSYRNIMFMKNYAQIQQHNADETQTYTKGVNKFTHLSREQFASFWLNKFYASQATVRLEESLLTMGPHIGDVDWQLMGKVSPVKNQGQCDAGYAFCSSSLTESFYRFDNKNVSLSEQQIIDCAANYTTFGCQGGSRNGTLQYIKAAGLNLDSIYPYKGVKSICQKPSGDYKPMYTQTEYTGCQNIQIGLNRGPVTVAVNAVDWLNYKTGIFNSCKSQAVHHDILLIGVTLTYWRLKNSWGLRWGEFGYIRLQIGNTCGICQKPAFGFK